MPDNTLNNGFCKQHSGVTSEIRHCQATTDHLDAKITNLETKMNLRIITVENKVDQIKTRLTLAALSFAFMAVGLFINLALKAF